MTRIYFTKSSILYSAKISQILLRFPRLGTFEWKCSAFATDAIKRAVSRFLCDLLSANAAENGHKNSSRCYHQSFLKLTAEKAINKILASCCPLPRLRTSTIHNILCRHAWALRQRHVINAVLIDHVSFHHFPLYECCYIDNFILSKKLSKILQYSIEFGDIVHCYQGRTLFSLFKVGTFTCRLGRSVRQLCICVVGPIS